MPNLATPRPKTLLQKRTREQQTSATRAALLNAALRVVSRYGYAKASVSRITEEAGVAMGTFYSYFDTHRQLLEELLPSEGTHLLNKLANDVRGSRDYFEHERRAFLSFFQYLRRNPHFLRVLTEAEIAVPTSHAQHMSNIEERYLSALHRAEMNKQISSQTDKSFRVVAEVLSGARGHIAIGLKEQSPKTKSAASPEAAADTYIKFIRNGLGEIGNSNLEPVVNRSRRNYTIKWPDDTRTILLRTAANLVHEFGYEATTIARITQSSNVAIATFYSYFVSRQQLLDEILNTVRMEMIEYVGDAVRGSKSFLELEQRGFLAFFDYLAKHPYYIRVETEAAVWAPKSYALHFRDIAERYVTAMRRSKLEGQLRDYSDDELQVIAYICMAARHYISTRYVLRGSASGQLPIWVSRAYLDLVRRGLQRE